MDNSSPPPESPPIQPAKIKLDRAQRDQEIVGFPPVHCPNKGRVECLHCHQLMPFDQFSDLTDPFCDACRAETPARELQDMRSRMCHDFSRQLALAEQGRLPLDRLEHFLSELMYDFGGMRVFVKAWSDQLKIAADKNPGGTRVLDQFRSIAKLVLDCNKLQHQENVLDLSDEQLRFKKEQALLQMLDSAATDPHRRQLLIELLRSGGIQLSEVPGLPPIPEVPAHAG